MLFKDDLENLLRYECRGEMFATASLKIRDTLRMVVQACAHISLEKVPVIVESIDIIP